MHHVIYDASYEVVYGLIMCIVTNHPSKVSIVCVCCNMLCILKICLKACLYYIYGTGYHSVFFSFRFESFTTLQYELFIMYCEKSQKKVA
jgi:hypothetical protein